MLRGWWVLLHAVIALGILTSGIPLAFAVACVLAALVHAVMRAPRRETPVLVLGADGRWCAPGLGLDGLALAPGSRFTAYWASLRLVGAAGELQVLLLADQIDDASWRRLQARLRRPVTKRTA